MSKQLSTERGALLPDVSGSVGPDAEETLLLAEARTEHPTAFADRHADRVRRMALRVTRNLADAEDAVQEDFKSALLHLNSFRGQSRLSTWLARITLNCALMSIRARRRELVPLDDSIEALVPAKCRRVLQSALTPEDSYLRRELEAILAKEIGGLKPRFQRAWRLCCADGLTTPDAAKVLGISPAPFPCFRSTQRNFRVGYGRTSRY